MCRPVVHGDGHLAISAADWARRSSISVNAKLLKPSIAATGRLLRPVVGLSGLRVSTVELTKLPRPGEARALCAGPSAETGPALLAHWLAQNLSERLTLRIDSACTRSGVAGRMVSALSGLQHRITLLNTDSEATLGRHAHPQAAWARWRQAGFRTALDGWGAGPLDLNPWLSEGYDEIWTDERMADRLPGPLSPRRGLAMDLFWALSRHGLTLVLRGVCQPGQLATAREYGFAAVCGPLLGSPMPLRDYLRVRAS